MPFGPSWRTLKSTPQTRRCRRSLLLKSTCSSPLCDSNQDQPWRPIPPRSDLPQSSAHRYQHTQEAEPLCQAVMGADLDCPSPSWGDAVAVAQSLNRQHIALLLYLSAMSFQTWDPATGSMNPLNAYRNPFYGVKSTMAVVTKVPLPRRQELMDQSSDYAYKY
jgi:hypothetical protein